MWYYSQKDSFWREILEWVVDTEVECQLVEFPVGDAPVFVGVGTWVVEWYGDVAPECEDGDVGADAESDAASDAFVKVADAEIAVGEIVRLVEEPYISEVREQRPFDDGYDRETVFEIGHHLDVAHAFKDVVVGVAVVAWAEVAQVPSANGCGTAAIEAFLEGHDRGVGVGETGAQHETRDEGGSFAEVEVMLVFGVESDIL